MAAAAIAFPSRRTRGKLASAAVAALAVLAVWAPAGEAANSNSRPATGSERAAIVAAYKAADGNVSEVHGVFVSRSNSGLAVVCARTPEAGTRSYVFSRHGHSWRYATSGPVGKAGNSAERTLERACG